MVRSCRQYKVYDLSSPGYPLLYCIPAAGISEVKLSSTHLLVARQPKHQQQPSAGPRAERVVLQSSCSFSEDEEHNTQDHYVPLNASTAANILDRPLESALDRKVDKVAGKRPAAAVSRQVVPLEVVSVINGQVSNAVDEASY